MQNKKPKRRIDNLAPIRVCLFFTYEINLKDWDRLGILDREITLYKNLVKQGIEVAFFTYGNQEDLDYIEELQGIKIIPAYASINKYKNRKLAFLQSLLLPFKFRKLFCRYNILKTNQMWGAWVPLITKWLTGNRFLVRCGYEHYYTLLAERWPSLIEKIIFYLFSKTTYFFSDHIIVTTKRIAEFITIKFAVPSKKISVISNLVNTNLFNIKSPPSLSKKQLVFVGRLSRQKNLFNLIEASKIAGVSLDLIGEGELRQELEKEVARINADVHFLGIYPNYMLPDILDRYQTFILTSLYEGNPKSLLEAMSCGKAVIGASVDGILEIIKDGQNGILCGTSSNEIAAAILKLKDNIELQKKLGENARQYIIENYSADKIILKEFKIYNGIVKNMQGSYEENNKKIGIQPIYS